MKAFRWIAASALFATFTAALWIEFRHSPLAHSLGVAPARAFAGFVLLLAPLWFFGFFPFAQSSREDRSIPNAGQRSSWVMVLAAPALALPYFVFALGTSVFYWRAAIIVVAFPMLLAALLSESNSSDRMTSRDALALAIITAAYFLNWLRDAWPAPGLAALSKLFLADIAAYCFLVVRKLRGSGYSLLPSRSALGIGLRETIFYLPIAFVLGKLTGFIHFHAVVPTAEKIVSAVSVTFLLVALPEELFFRSILQNLLETRVGRGPALLLAAALFGLSHFNHGATFNWRYVLLASIAGIFYGRAWRAQRQIFSSVVTHTLVDVIWSLWFH